MLGSDLVANLGEAARYYAFDLLDGARRESVASQQAELDLAQWISPEDLRDWQTAKLYALLNHARDSVDHYRLRIPLEFPVEESWNVLESLPVVSREHLEKAPEAFLSDRYKRSQLRSGFTSGSVGHAVRFWTDRARRRRVLAELAYFGGWAGYSIGMRHLFLRQTMPESTKNRLRLWPKNQVLYNTSILNEERLREITCLLETSHVKVLFAYPWTLHMLALYLKRNARSPRRHGLKAVISLGGALPPGTRTLVEELLGAQVFERYSALEVGTIASECEKRRMHVNVGSLHIEGMSLGETPAGGEPRSRQVVISDLFNYGMPLLRYDLGDRVEFAAETCPCGRTSPVVKRIFGRAVDQIATPAGDWVDPFRIGNLLRDVPSLKQYQFLQVSADRYELRAVARPVLRPDVAAEVRRRYRSLLGPQAKVDVVEVHEISTLPSGKRPFIVNRMARDAARTERDSEETRHVEA